MLPIEVSHELLLFGSKEPLQIQTEAFTMKKVVKTKVLVAGSDTVSFVYATVIIIGRITGNTTLK